MWELEKEWKVWKEGRRFIWPYYLLLLCRVPMSLRCFCIYNCLHGLVGDGAVGALGSDFFFYWSFRSFLPWVVCPGRKKGGEASKRGKKDWLWRWRKCMKARPMGCCSWPSVRKTKARKDVLCFVPIVIGDVLYIEMPTWCSAFPSLSPFFWSSWSFRPEGSASYRKWGGWVDKTETG